MFLGVYRLPRSEMGFPRVRGDVPCFRYLRPGEYPFSPRARGCSQAFKLRSRWRLVFPACAGMFLAFDTSALVSIRFPRVRGDVPRLSNFAVDGDLFSPRARGCSPTPTVGVVPIIVFPACAGMFLCHLARNTGSVRFPRVRGDVPKRRAARVREYSFSPRTRGCSGNTQGCGCWCRVFPAHAGMFRVNM